MGKEDAICVQISGSEVPDCKVMCEMMELIKSEQIQRFVGDKGYDTNKIRAWLKDNDIYAEIPNKRNRVKKFRFDKTVYKWRYRIENLFCRIKENRRLAMRVDKLDVTFMGFIALALIKIHVC